MNSDCLSTVWRACIFLVGIGLFIVCGAPWIGDVAFLVTFCCWAAASLGMVFVAFMTARKGS